MTIKEAITELIKCERLDDELYAHLVWRNKETNSVVEDLNCPVSFVRTTYGDVTVEMGYK